MSPALAGRFFTASATWEAHNCVIHAYKYMHTAYYIHGVYVHVYMYMCVTYMLYVSTIHVKQIHCWRPLPSLDSSPWSPSSAALRTVSLLRVCSQLSGLRRWSRACADFVSRCPPALPLPALRSPLSLSLSETTTCFSPGDGGRGDRLSGPCMGYLL